MPQYIAMEPLPVALKMHVEVELDGKPLKITAQVEGEGETARHAAAELASAVAAVISQTTHTSAPDPITQTALSHSVNETPASLSQPSEELTKPFAQQAPSAMKPVQSPMAQWIGRNRARINLSAGGLLLALAVFIPIIVPPDQRSEVLIMTILFGITGALLLATAMLPTRNAVLKPRQAASGSIPRPITARPHPMPARAKSTTKPNPVRTAWGIGLGVVFILTGFVAPFALGATSADERFIIMLGFAPVVVVGFFMLAIFGRGLFKFPPPVADTSEPISKPSSSGVVAAKRAPITRVPQSLEYKAIVPAAIIGLLIVMVAVVALVIFATVSSAVR